MTESGQSTGGNYPYAACRDCPLYRWAEDEEQAETLAEKHSEEFSHDGYADSTRSVDPGTEHSGGSE